MTTKHKRVPMSGKARKRWAAVAVISGCVLGAIFFPMLFDAIGATPRFVVHDWLELDKMAQIGKFRSTLGHGYGLFGDSNPTSDKHYFTPAFQYGNRSDSVKCFSPFDGTIESIQQEQHRLSDGSIQGQQIHVRSSAHPSIVVILFHINVLSSTTLFQHVSEGQQLGYLDMREGSGTDIAVMRLGDYISWFEIMSDELFATYQARGIPSREYIIKTQTEADNSAAAGYGFNPKPEDPSDQVALKNTLYPRMISTSFTNASRYSHYSFTSNGLITTRTISVLNLSNSVWFRVKDAYSATPSTEVFAPYNGTVSRLMYDGIGNYRVEITWDGSPPAYRVSTWVYNVNITGTGLAEGNHVVAGQRVGNVTKYVGVEVVVDMWNVAIPVFSLMDDAPWAVWAADGIVNRTAMLLNHQEFLAIQSTLPDGGYTGLVDGVAWWIPL